MNRTGDARGVGEAMAPSSFCMGKSEKGNKEKKERVSEQKLIIDCQQRQNVTVLAILERLVSKTVLRNFVISTQLFKFCATL